MSNSLSSPLLGDKESFISCRNSQGAEVRATPVRLTRFTVVFEVYNPFSIIQMSEVLSEFNITINDRLSYSGRAVVSNLVNTGIMVVCEATLDEAWLDVDIFSPISQPNRLRQEFDDFITEWRKIRTVTPEFKVAVADFQTLLIDLRRWLDQVELGVRSEPVGVRSEMELKVLSDLEGRIIPEVGEWMDRFDSAANLIVEEQRPAHRAYARRQLHPLVLCAPFVYRSYQKPLGYAGDYEMVNMILRDPHEGATMFAKLVNVVFLQSPASEAHRNRIKHLKIRLKEETQRAVALGRRLKVLNLGCGPAKEVQEFMTEDAISDNVDFVLLDFNSQTLDYTRSRLLQVRETYGRKTSLELAEKSINQLLRESSRGGGIHGSSTYDFVYCAGLFDYVSDRVCKRLIDLFYEHLAVGGLLLATNVDCSKPFRAIMDYLLEWHLIYRDRENMRLLAPTAAVSQPIEVLADPTEVNLYLEVRKTSG
jgi:extracellular factor (EF) 3-hydroxypalmitic acid methyl ester biosynthesis protein